METSENTATPSPAPANGATRRRSGRERRAPEKFQPEVTTAPKRKRAEDDEDDENQDPDDAAAADEDEDMSDDEDDDSAEDSPDEEEQRAARRQQKSKKKGASQASRVKKPAAKKPKINGAAPAAATAQSISVGLPSRPKPKKSARVVTGDRRDGDGVYGEYCRG